MYVDDSGQAGTKISRRDNGLYVLGGLIVRETHWKRIEADLALAKRKFLPTLDPDEWELHAHDMWNSKGIFADEKLSINHAQKKHIFSEVLSIVCRSSATIVGVVISKDRLRDRSTAQRTMDHAWTILTEQFENFLKQQAAHTNSGLICMDTSDRSTESVIGNLVYRLVRKGTLRQKIDHVVDSPVFMKSHLKGMIQLSDMIAYVIHKHHKGDRQFKAWFEALLPKMHLSGGGLGKRGVRTFP